MTDILEIQIAAAPVRDAIPADKTLVERLDFAMDYVLKHERDLFWMSHNANDELKFKTALAGIMLGCGEEDKFVIERSLRPLKALAALMSGVPVDIEAIETKDILPLMKMFHAAKERHDQQG